MMPNPTTAVEWVKNCQTLGHLRKIQEHLRKFPDLLLRAMCEVCADAHARQQVREALGEAQKDIHWLLEFVVEPEFFPNLGDRQYWHERVAAIAAALRGGTG